MHERPILLRARSTPHDTPQDISQTHAVSALERIPLPRRRDIKPFFSVFRDRRASRVVSCRAFRAAAFFFKSLT
jgi:hypothetical protein